MKINIKDSETSFGFKPGNVYIWNNANAIEDLIVMVCYRIRNSKVYYYLLDLSDGIENLKCTFQTACSSKQNFIRKLPVR
mgnify:CR=1 FL=1